MFDKRLMTLCPESKKYIITNILLQWLDLIMNTIMMAIIAYILSGLYYKVLSSNYILLFSVILFTILIRIFTSKQALRMSFLASKTIKFRMRELIFNKLLKLGNAYRESVSTAEIVQESVEGVEQLESYFGQYVPQFFYAFIAPITLFFIFGFAGSWLTAVVLLVCVPLIPSAIMMVQKIAKKILAKYWGQYTQLGSTFLENLEGMTILKTYQADAYKNELMNQESEHFRVITMKVLTMQLNSIIIMDLFAYGGAAIGIILATRTFVLGKLPLANTLFMILLSAEFFLPMRRLGSYFHVAMNGMAASDKIFKFLSSDDPSPREEEIQQADISMSHVYFSYEEKREILKDITLNIPKGSFVGIVGESGSGKSTIVSLLRGINTITQGTITIGTKDIKTICEENLMKNITYVGHQGYFFKGTVLENLITENETKAWEALQKCQLADYLKGQNGLETQLLENASNLSGGQKQRLNFARALLQDSPIYIFDEATSNIDMESEEIILNEIKKLKNNKTVILISHRLVNVVDADIIYVLDQGSIVEQGKHSDLLNENGVYASLWDVQDSLENFRKDKAYEAAK